MDGFDFLHGDWTIENRRLRARLAGCAEWDEFPSTAWCRGLLGGGANIDEFTFPTLGLRATTLRLFDRAEQAWSLHWSTSASGRLDPPLRGGFAGGRGEFYGDDTEAGVPVRVRFVWTPDADRPRWEQAFSTDGGATWEINWVMAFARA